MSTLTITLTPTAVNNIGAKWCIEGVTRWLNSGDTATFTYSADQIISYKYVEDYMQPASETIFIGSATRTYTATTWLSSWGTPISGCEFKGQVLLAGRVHTVPESFPSDSRIIRWSEIGAFRFLGATANAIKNEAGFTYLKSSNDEMVMRVLPLKDIVIVYGSLSVITLTPVTAPAPTFGINELVSGIGIANPLAVAGSKNEHIYIDKEGKLREIGPGQYGQGIISKDLGYSHIFGPMQEDFNMTTGTGVIAIVYNPDSDEYYISNGKRSFVYNKTALTEIGVAITSYVNLHNARVSTDYSTFFTEAPIGGATQLLNNEYMYIETDIHDFGLSAIKTIQQVEIAGGFGTSGEASIMIKWRNNRSENFRSTDWRRCSPNGVATPIVSGTDFKICIRIRPVTDVLINNITVEWKLIDKSSVRGNYAG